jgi:hypothetical protein
VTEGEEYSYFMTGVGQGQRTRIDAPPMPDKQFFRRGLDEVVFSSDIDTI